MRMLRCESRPRPAREKQRARVRDSRHANSCMAGQYQARIRPTGFGASFATRVPYITELADARTLLRVMRADAGGCRVADVAKVTLATWRIEGLSVPRVSRTDVR